MNRRCSASTTTGSNEGVIGSITVFNDLAQWFQSKFIEFYRIFWEAQFFYTLWIVTLLFLLHQTYQFIFGQFIILYSFTHLYHRIIRFIKTHVKLISNHSASYSGIYLPENNQFSSGGASPFSSASYAFLFSSSSFYFCIFYCTKNSLISFSSPFILCRYCFYRASYYRLNIIWFLLVLSTYLAHACCFKIPARAYYEMSLLDK